MQQVTLPEAIEVLKNGEVLLYPTETVYGMGVDIENPEALQKIFRLKGRAATQAISVLVPARETIYQLVKELNDISLFLIENFLPGPLTLVLPAAAGVAAELTGGSGRIGIRLSSHPLAARLVQAFGRPITTTSANPGGRDSGRTLAQLREYFEAERQVSLLPSGDLPVSPGSTVLSVEADSLKLLREGEIKFTEIQNRLRTSNIKFRVLLP